MAELKDVVGALLKELAQARVLADLFSRDVSREYAKDPLLGAFPVPRAEIREVSMQLKFAVNAVEPGKVDPHAVARERVPEHARELAQEVFHEFIEKHPQATNLLKLLGEKELDLAAAMESAVANALLADPALTEAALRGRAEAVARAAGSELERVLFAEPELKRLVTRAQRPPALRAALREKAAAMAVRLVANLRDAVAAAEKLALRIDVSVTRKELAEAPEFVLSQISLTADIRNYQWVEAGEERGRPVRHLQPE
jgi:hypothetical protein